jgi:hypothetical protein
MRFKARRRFHSIILASDNEIEIEASLQEIYTYSGVEST